MVRSYTIDRSKKFAIVDKGKVISKHVDFYNAQKAVEKHFKNRKITNDYKIVPLSELEKSTTYNCKQCGKEMTPVDYFINPVCLKCCQKNQKKATGGLR